MHTYKTAQVAEILGVHPNTVRLYETMALIPKAERAANGYRVFTERHIAVFRLARTAFQVEVLQNGLRKKAVRVVKTAAAGDFASAIALAEAYLAAVRREAQHAGEAIGIVKQIMSGDLPGEAMCLRRHEAAEHLEISMDTLRNWEMNGLLSVRRRANGYRVYTGEDIRRLKVIRSLRCANYSLEAILRMLSALSANPEADIGQTLDTPAPDAEIISVYDKLVTSLNAAACNARAMLAMLGELQGKY